MARGFAGLLALPLLGCVAPAPPPPWPSLGECVGVIPEEQVQAVVCAAYRKAAEHDPPGYCRPYGALGGPTLIVDDAGAVRDMLQPSCGMVIPGDPRARRCSLVAYRFFLGLRLPAPTGGECAQVEAPDVHDCGLAGASPLLR